MIELSLTSDLEQFTGNCVRNDRHHSFHHIAEAAMRLLQNVDADRAAFITTLEEAEAEGERNGFLTIEDVEREIDKAVETSRRA